MNRDKLDMGVSFLLRLGLGMMFMVAGVLKISDVDGFVSQIANYQLFPEWSAYLGVTIPAIEILIGTAIILSPKMWRQAAEWVLLAMLVGFSLVVARAWWLGIDVECGCFGAGSSKIGPWVIARNLSLITATGLLLVVEVWGVKLPFRTSR